MCVVIAKQSSAKPPTEEVLRKAWHTNPHGAGFAFVNTDKGITIKKGYMVLDDLLKALEPILAVKTASYLIHFRIATHGTKDDVNTHPFWAVKDKLAVVHNGILPYSSLVKNGEGRSDTNAFTEDILSKLPEGWYNEECWRHVVEQYMGSGNKLAVLSPEGIKLFNKNGWTEDTATGLLYSNMHWRPYQSSTTHHHGSVQRGYYSGYIEGDEWEDGYYGNRHRTVKKEPQKTEGTFLPPTTPTTGIPVANFAGAARRAYNSVCTRMALLRKRGAMTEFDVDGFKDCMKLGQMEPEAVENTMDLLWEAVKETPESTIDDLKVLMDAKDYHELVKKCHEMTVSDDKASGNEETVKIEAALTNLKTPPPSDGTIIDAEKTAQYNEENTKGFVGQVICIEMTPSAARAFNVPVKRFGTMVEATKDVMVYRGLDSPDIQARLAWNMIAGIRGALNFIKPDAKVFTNIFGAKVLCESTVGLIRPIVGVVCGIFPSSQQIQLRLTSGTTIMESISTIARVIVLDLEPRKLHLEATSSK